MKMRAIRFYGPDNGLDETIPAPPASSLFATEEPAPAALPEGYVLADEQAAGPTEAQLKADYDRLMAENAQLKDRPDPTQALAPILQEFSAGIKGLAERPIHVQAPAAQPPVDFEAEERSIDESFLEGPSKHVKKIVGSLVNEPLQVLLESNMTLARSIVGSREGDKAVFAKYNAEIEAEVAAIPLGTRARDPVAAYDRAVAVVRGRHFQELLAEEKQTWAQTGQPPATQAPAAAPAPAQAPRAAAISGSPMAPPPAGGRAITKAEAATVENYMRENGTPADKFDTILELVREGAIR